MPSIDQGGRKEGALYGLIEVFANDAKADK
jgi:hypothetical protein